jgi:hypothetical protein
MFACAACLAAVVLAVSAPTAAADATDVIPPETTVLSGPGGPTNDATPEFAFSSSEEATFRCRLYLAGQESVPGFGACSSPHASEPLADRPYVFEVAAVDAAGNEDASPGARAFRVDTVAPNTFISAGPGDTTATDTTFVFAANEVGSFSCRLDDGAWRPCSSPQSYSRLALGPHRFDVRAADRAGNEATPASHAWQVLKPGARIPAAGAQAVALAQELVQLREALRRTRLRKISRRRAIRLDGFDALTAGTAELRARARPKHRPRGVSFAVALREVPAAGSYPLEAKITRQGRRLARHRARLPIELKLTFTDRAGRSLWATTTTTMVR